MNVDRKKILLVDDSVTSLFMEKMVLRQGPYDLVTASDGREGVERALSERPDLIVMDVVMPNMSGVEALRELRARPETRGTPVILVTTRGEPVLATTTVRAMVPVSVRARNAGGKLGNQISALLVDLPVGEPSPVVRLHHVTHAMRAHTSTGQSVGADTLVRIGGFAPPTLHALGARAASGISKLIFNLVVTNVPGPQFPLYAAGARMLEMYPVVPLAKGQALAIGLTSYDGGVFYGLNGDRGR